jgi:hypothetical protein
LSILSFLASHVWLFEGAEGGKWLEDLVKDVSDETNLRMDARDARDVKKARVG